MKLSENALRKSHLLSPHIEGRTALGKTAGKLGIGLHHATHHAEYRWWLGHQRNWRSDGNGLCGRGFSLTHLGGAGEKRLAPTLRLSIDCCARLRLCFGGFGDHGLLYRVKVVWGAV